MLMIVTNNEDDEQEDLGGREVIDIDGRIRWRHGSSYVLPACVDIGIINVAAWCINVAPACTSIFVAVASKLYDHHYCYLIVSVLVSLLPANCISIRIAIQLDQHQHCHQFVSSSLLLSKCISIIIAQLYQHQYCYPS